MYLSTHQVLYQIRELFPGNHFFLPLGVNRFSYTIVNLFIMINRRAEILIVLMHYRQWVRYRDTRYPRQDNKV